MKYHFGEVDFGRATLQIGKTLKENYFSVGSGFIYHDGKMNYLVSAAHVMRAIQLKSDDDFLTITANGYSFHLNTAKFVDGEKTLFFGFLKDKITDFALLPLPDRFLEKIFQGAKDILIVQNEFIAPPVTSEGDYYMSAYGFPCSTNKRPSDVSNRYGGLRNPHLLRVTGRSRPNDLEKEKGFGRGSHVAMSFSRKGMNDLGQSATIPLPNGMSGGLMSIHYKNSDGISETKAIGLVSTLSRKNDLIIGVSFELIRAFTETYSDKLFELKLEMEDRFRAS